MKTVVDDLRIAKREVEAVLFARPGSVLDTDAAADAALGKAQEVLGVRRMVEAGVVIAKATRRTRAEVMNSIESEASKIRSSDPRLTSEQAIANAAQERNDLVEEYELADR